MSLGARIYVKFSEPFVNEAGKLVVQVDVCGEIKEIEVGSDQYLKLFPPKEEDGK